jgi:hypothetical protein
VTRRIDGAVAGAALLLAVYLLTLAPDVTFWDAGEFIAAAHSLGIPHPPGTPLFIMLANVWGKLLGFLPFAVATNLMSAVATAVAALLTGRMVRESTGSDAMAFASAVMAGGMSTVWLNATETEAYSIALLLATLMIWSANRAGRAATERDARRFVWLAGYLMMLAVPLHLIALVVSPVAMVLVVYATPPRWRHGILLFGVFLMAMGVGRMSVFMVAAGAVITIASQPRIGGPMLAFGAVAVSAIAFMYVRARFDPAINQGDPGTWQGLVDMVARRQYDVSPLWPRKASILVQFGNLMQYADWQAALSFGPTVLPSVLRTVFTILLLALGFQGAQEHYDRDRRTFFAVATLLLCGSLGVLVYLNLHAGPSIGYGILPANTAREARERDYFYLFAFWPWGIWAGIGAVHVMQRFSRPAWAGALLACLPLVTNWRAVTRRAEPEARLPLAFASELLESTPRYGVLFVVGDNDSYPLWYAQQVKERRRDVTVVTLPLLPTEWYRRQLSTRFGLLGPEHVHGYDGRFETAARIAQGARDKGRPVVASATMSKRERERLGGSWTAAGMVYLEGSAAIDTALTSRSAERTRQALGSAQPREAIDPVNTYFRRVLDCPRQLVELSRAQRDSTQLDSICNYR